MINKLVDVVVVAVRCFSPEDGKFLVLVECFPILQITTFLDFSPAFFSGAIPGYYPLNQPARTLLRERNETSRDQAVCKK